MVEIDFDKMQGLAPAIVQDEASGEVLMLGFMNREALRMTLDSGYATFFSRTRGKLWRKGETSGNRLKVTVERSFRLTSARINFGPMQKVISTTGLRSLKSALRIFCHSITGKRN